LEDDDMWEEDVEEVEDDDDLEKNVELSSLPPSVVRNFRDDIRKP
jgi:hypothetical protein